MITFSSPLRQIADEGQSVVIGFSVSDVDGDPVSVTLAGAPAGAVIERTGDIGEFRWVATDGDATYPFEIVAGDGQAEVRTEAAVLVKNVAPTLNVQGDAQALSGQPYTLSLQSSDPGQDTIQQWIVDWGDGTLQTTAGTAHELTHTYQQPEKRYRIQVGAIDEDGAWSAAPRVVEVVNDRLWVKTFTPTDTGFTVRFSRSFAPEALNLYESALAPRGGPDIVFTDAQGQVVRGSVVLDADNQGLSFVASGGLLPGGTYSLTLSSRDNAFKDSLGRTLDGNKDNVSGDDYRVSFTLAPRSAPGVAIANAVIGPKQLADVPATGHGIPITLTSTQAAPDIRFTLRYDPAKLTVAGIEGGADLPANSQFTITGTPGALSIHVVASNPLAAGTRQLLKLIASVPQSATYGSAEVLDISAVSVDNRSGRAGDGVHVVAYLGDTTGDARYTSLDAQRDERLRIGVDTGLNAYPTLDPLLVGDVDRDGAITSNDTAMIVKETQFILGGQTNASLDQPQIAPVPAAQRTPVLGAGGQVVQAPAPAVLAKSAAAITPVSPVVASAFSLSETMNALNALRATTPAQDLALRFLKGERTWDDAAPVQPSAQDGWKVSLPKLTQGIGLPASIEASGVPEGTLQALKYVVAKKARKG